METTTPTVSSRSTEIKEAFSRIMARRGNGAEEEQEQSPTEKPIRGGAKGLPPPWITGDMEKPAETVNHGTWTSSVFSAEQQQRLGVDAQGNKVADSPEAEGKSEPNPTEPRLFAQHSAGGPQDLPSSTGHQALPPPWLTGRMEKPAGERTEGTMTRLFYTEEQQKRLGVDEDGKKIEPKAQKALPPAWLTGGIEKPAGERTEGTMTRLFYTEEQQKRLGVDEDGKKREPASATTGVKALPPPWILGKIEKPAGVRQEGTYSRLYYTEEQQKRLGVDEDGKQTDKK